VIIMATPDELREASQRLQRVAELEEEADNDLEDVKQIVVDDDDEIQLSLRNNLSIFSEHEAVVKVCKDYNINASQAKRHVESFPKTYELYGQGIPDVVKAMRKERRNLKGNDRLRMSKSIDDLIDGYSEHLSKCIDSVYWIGPYREAFIKMRFDEKDLSKLNKMKESSQRRRVIDSLCKYWEAELDQKETPYGRQFSILQKEMNSAKKAFRAELKTVTDSSIRKSLKEQTNDYILKQVSSNQGISARELHDRMPSKLYDRSSWHSISKMVKALDITSIEGRYYNLDSEIKKNIWAYTAAFIDSDGYITMDRNHNPRVGLVATGDRGKAFMTEIHKALGGIGKLHLDQKSPQDTRPVNRLNFYSQAEVTELLSKCLPHFRLKKGNANLLLELIRMKKSYKKADWYKGRCDEIFKLMKWENHKDHVGFDFAKEGIYVDDISKYQDNCKMSVMDEMENVGGIVV
tara:strand:+ start:6992 stop:8377 length:1386 start_codon:yes stop_codon:yes gene_type:complete